MLCFIQGALGNRFSLMTKAARCDFIVNYIARSFGDKAKAPLTYVDHMWGGEAHIGGGFGVTWQPGVYSQFGKYLNMDFKRVTWIGSDTIPLESPNVTFQFS